jgi:hypothetical protein
MNWLAENALPIWVCGAIALTMAVIVFLQTRAQGALLAVLSVVVITAALLLVEQMLETPHEAVERTLYELAAAVEANDVDAAADFLAPNADPAIRSDVQTLMPLVKIDRARIMGSPKIEVASGPEPTTATAQIRGIIVAVIKQSGMKGGQEDELTLELVRDGDRWLIESYTSKRKWHRALGR